MNKISMKKIGLIEDNSIIRDAYSNYFKVTKSFDVVFAVGDFADALIYKDTLPSIILLDENLPSGSGIDRLGLLAQNFPSSKVVILSSTLDDKLTKLAMDNGASGYLLKSSSISYICESLLQMENGGMPFSPATIAHLIQPPKETQNHSSGLTKREWELIKLLSEGYSNKVAADKLHVTYFTINQHLKNIYKKLNINSKPELISWFLSGRIQNSVA
jgi:DNA-binding NarL/FixJ family response regulator